MQEENKERLPTHVIGTVELMLKVNTTEFTLVLQYVLYCPQMLYNLNAISEALNIGLCIKIDNDYYKPTTGILKIINTCSGDVCLAAPETECGLYHASLTPESNPSVFAAVKLSNRKLHECLGHTSTARITHSVSRVTE